MDRDLGGRRDDLVVLADVSRTEVDEYINDKHDINCNEGSNNVTSVLLVEKFEQRISHKWQNKLQSLDKKGNLKQFTFDLL